MDGGGRPLETRSYATYATIPNLVALGQTVFAYIGPKNGDAGARRSDGA